MFEKDYPSRQPERRDLIVDLLSDLEKLGWEDFQLLNAKNAREACHVFEHAAAWCQRRYLISIEQSHD